MRYYLTEMISDTLVIVAEVIGRRDPTTGTPIPHPLADHGGALTREDVLELRGGGRALLAWQSGDDTPYAEAAEERRRVWDAEEAWEL